MCFNEDPDLERLFRRFTVMLPFNSDPFEIRSFINILVSRAFYLLLLPIYFASYGVIKLILQLLMQISEKTASYGKSKDEC